MNAYDILTKLSFQSAQGTSQMADFNEEVKDRLKDLDYVTHQYENCLLIGATAPEMTAWVQKFGKIPIGISLDDFPWVSRDVDTTNEHLIIYKQDMHNLEFQDKSFDFIYASQVLEHSPAPMVVLIQINRVLKLQGDAFFWIPVDEENRKEKYHFSCFSKEVWEDLFNKAGFELKMLTKRFNSWGYYITKIKCLSLI